MNSYLINASNEYINIPNSGTPIISSEVRGYNPSTVLSFIDLLPGVIENNPDYNTYEILYPTSPTCTEYILPQKLRDYGTNVLIVTDRVTNSQYSDYPIPLFFQYQLMYDSYLYDPSLYDGFITLRKNMDSVISYDNYIVETRSYPTSSGRYNTDTTPNFLWGSRPIQGNITTTRLLLPVREKDNFYNVEYNKYFNTTITDYYNELVNEVTLYQENTDYTITPSSILLKGSNIGSGSIIYCQRDPKSFIKIKPPVYTDDNIKKKPWNFQITCGEVNHSSGVLGGTSKFKISNPDYSISQPYELQSEIPKYINKNVIKLNTTPLYKSASGYPDYDITKTIISGVINGEDLSKYVKSIDYDFGYIYLSKEIKSDDNMLLTYTYDNSKTMVINNVDLNPVNFEKSFIDIANESIGIALVPSGTIFKDVHSNDVTYWTNVAYYKISDNVGGDFAGITTYGYGASNTPDTSITPISGIIPSGSISIGFFSVNTISKDMVKLYDTRRLGGYAEADIKLKDNWYGFSDIGFWDGKAFPKAGTILIQIPKEIYYNISNIFKNNKRRYKTLSLYTKDLTNLIEKDSKPYDDIEQQINRETNKYIRDVIERYLPTGYLYIIVDEDFNLWPSIRGN